MTNEKIWFDEAWEDYLYWLTQEELAGKLAVTPQAVSRWENGQSYPDVAMIPEIIKTNHEFISHFILRLCYNI